MPPLTMPIYEPDHKAEKIKSIFQKMKHKACIKKENKLLIDILKKAENKKAKLGENIQVLAQGLAKSAEEVTTPSFTQVSLKEWLPNN